jgi:type III secretion system YscQ/HrcQ family protein
MHRPLSLPRIAATEAQALSRLTRQVLELPLQAWAVIGSDTPAPLLSLRHLGFGASPLNPEDAVRSRIEWSGSRLALDIPKAAAEEWTDAVTGGGPSHGLPGPWRTFALERALQWVVASLTACGKGTARLAETGQMAIGVVEGTRHRFLLSLDFAESVSSIHGVLHCDNLGLLMLASLLPAGLVEAQGPLETASVPLRLDLTLGYTDLSADGWRSLGLGDVIFIQRPLFDGPQVIALRVRVPGGPGRCLMARREGQHLTITSEAFTMSEPADHPEDEPTEQAGAEPTGEMPADAEPAAPIGQVQVRLNFDVGHHDISLDELARLQPGEVLKLDQPVADLVTVRANGVKVGTGTLVEVEGRVGVMLTLLASPNRAP